MFRGRDGPRKVGGRIRSGGAGKKKNGGAAQKVWDVERKIPTSPQTRKKWGSRQRGGDAERIRKKRRRRRNSNCGFLQKGRERFGNWRSCRRRFGWDLRCRRRGGTAIGMTRRRIGRGDYCGCRCGVRSIGWERGGTRCMRQCMWEKR